MNQQELNTKLLLLAKMCLAEMERRERAAVWKSVLAGIVLAGAIFAVIWRLA